MWVAGSPVLYVNDLRNDVEPIVLPDEELTVKVIKDGKEHNQWVAYLDGGTMIVVEVQVNNTLSQYSYSNPLIDSKAILID